MKNNKSWLYLLLITTIIVIGIILRIIPAFNQPIWLDEQYSLYFAHLFSPQELLMFFNADQHPGGYYLLLKLINNWAPNLFLLRLVTAVLPQAILMFLIVWQQKVLNLRKTELIVLLIILAINPFFIELGWWLRMYGLIFLLSGLNYIFYMTWKKTRYKNHLTWLILSLLISNVFSYLMMINSFAFLWLVVKTHQSWNKQKKILSFITISGIYLLLFFTLAGFSLKDQSELASWIDSPTIQNIPGQYLSIVGLNHDPSNQHPILWQLIIIFYLSVGFILLRLNKAQINKNGQFCEFFILCVIPTLTIFVVSLLLPFLSQRFFFHHFTPNISLFLPRSHLSIAVIASFFITKYANQLNNNHKPLFLIGFSLIIFIWMANNLSRAIGQNIHTNKRVALQNELNNQNIIIWPSWVWIKSISVEKISLLELRYQLSKSEVVENTVANNNNLDCDVIQSKILLIEPNVISGLEHNRQKISELAKKCCHQEQNFHKLEKWICP